MIIKQDYGETGGFSETLLWSNASPTTAQTSQDISLNDDLSNFTHIRVVYRYSTGVTTTAEFIIPISQLKTLSALSAVPYVVLHAYVNSSTTYLRNLFAVAGDTTKLAIGGASGDNNGYCIVTAIYGLK